ncbi:MAG: ATP phosphoribosyltransferase [Leptospiraceae bacterium]|nr:ATP phosphoribosyltransferase [Leptospiraceae bacterium]MCK6380690.1 ATP phosphoribosyltransferase [Leptospiraceae bacterium]NUO79179.1 ATP phosphoribosyltransferase [candidate division KSB1 bacterium]
MLTLALPKGRLAEESMEILVKKNWLKDLPSPNSKELAYEEKSGKVKLLFVRSQDVPTYVEEKAADCGFIGFDILREGSFDLIQALDVEIGKCRLSLASKPEFIFTGASGKIRVATKYPNLTREFFFSKGISCEIIKLYGSIELAPLCGLSDCIVDLVSTGETLRANGLKEIEVIMHSTARLVFNRSSLYQKRKEALELISDISR